jgi:leucyl/phenylalanyl-tRNA--protein transferase
MKRAYCALHEAGYAHSVEAWEGEELAGGLYGVSLGACFFGESMFTRSANASKVALAVLVDQLTRWKFHFIDCQLKTRHLESLGAREVRRRTYLSLLDKALRVETRRGRWVYEAALAAGPKA